MPCPGASPALHTAFLIEKLEGCLEYNIHLSLPTVQVDGSLSRHHTASSALVSILICQIKMALGCMEKVQSPSSLAFPAAHALLRALPPGPPRPPATDTSLVRPRASHLNSASFCLVNSNPWLPFLQGAYTLVSLGSLITRTLSSPLCTFLVCFYLRVLCSMSPYKISEHLSLPRCVVNQTVIWTSSKPQLPGLVSACFSAWISSSITYF